MQGTNNGYTLPRTLIMLCLITITTSDSEPNIIETLPGYPDTLPFKLETGYIGVGEDEEVQLFYYFVESERDPDSDPLIFWLTGGPGCSGFSALIYEIGPLRFNISRFDGSSPRLILNPYSWTKVANIIFIDSPVGTGFSYARAPGGFHSNDTKAVVDNYTFLKNWFLIHPRFIKNRFYIAGDSYGGKIVPMVALEIAKGNDGGLEPRMCLQGYLIGNPTSDKEALDFNERIPYAHRMALISDEYFESAKRSCNEKYVNPEPTNVHCCKAVARIDEVTENLNFAYILDPNCGLFQHKRDSVLQGAKSLEDDPEDFLLTFKQGEPSCRNNNYLDSAVWANYQTVQEALYIRKGTIQEWQRCHRSLSYEEDIHSAVPYHQILNQKGFSILVYSGDHDMIVPYLSTVKWIHILNLTVEETWRPWTVDGQIAGYTEKYKNNGAYFTFATVKGAGHTAPEYMPKQCLAMIERWLSLHPL